MECSDLRILFAGNPSIAVPALEALSEAFTVVGVLTNPDRPVGRGRHMEAPPVKDTAIRLGIPVLQYERLLGDARTQVAALQPNFLVSFACGHYFGPKFLALFSQGTANIHPSLLPKYRGSAPLQFALLNGESHTGISIQRIVAKIDSGNILAQETLSLDGTETTQSLGDIVAVRAASLITDTLERLCAGRLVETVQREEDATFSSLLNKSDGLVDWTDSARSLHCKVRAYAPWPKAYTTYQGIQLMLASVHGPVDTAGEEPLPPGTVCGTVVKHVKGKGLAIACKDGLLYVDRLQLAQKKEMDSTSFINGNPRIIGSVLGT